MRRKLTAMFVALAAAAAAPARALSLETRGRDHGWRRNLVEAIPRSAAAFGAAIFRSAFAAGGQGALMRRAPATVRVGRSRRGIEGEGVEARRRTFGG